LGTTFGTPKVVGECKQLNSSWSQNPGILNGTMAKNKLQTASKQPAPDEFKGQQQLARIVSEERQSRHWAPARSRVTVNEWEQRRIGITYRGQRLAFHQIFRRPEKPAARVEPPAKRKQHPQPAAHHPWRFSYKAPPLSSTLAKRAWGNSMQTEQQLGWNTLLE
jgi:hypothetical protein